MDEYLLGIDNDLTMAKSVIFDLGGNEIACASSSTNIESKGFTGGASRSDIWCQIFADILNLEIETVEVNESGALGAAIVAGIASGIYKDIEDASNRVIKLGKCYKPNKENNKVYEEKYKKFKKIVEFMNEI